MAPGRKHASFQLRSQSDNGVIIELTPLPVCGCISLRLTLSGATLTSFPMQPLLCASWAAREGLKGSPWPSRHASCSPDVGARPWKLHGETCHICGIPNLGGKPALLHCVVLMEEKVGAALVWIVLWEGAQYDIHPCPHPPLPPEKAWGSRESQGWFSLCCSYLDGVGGWKFHIFSPRNFKTVRTCATLLSF